MTMKKNDGKKICTKYAIHFAPTGCGQGVPMGIPIGKKLWPKDDDQSKDGDDHHSLVDALLVAATKGKYKETEK